MRKLLTTTLLVLALTAGGAAYAQDHQSGCDGQGGQHFHAMFSKLPKASAMIIHNAMKKAFEDSKDLRAQSKQVHADLRAILTDDDFDQDAFIAKQAEAQQLHDKVKANMSTAFASALVQLSPTDRKIIADSMAHHHGYPDRDAGHGKHTANKSSAGKPASADPAE